MPAAEDRIIRQLLTAIEDDAAVSQRRLSSDVGIAVGSVNWYLKRCLSKGLIKLQDAPVKRYLYYLTPQGFEEKARLTSSFLQSSFELYRRGRKECADFFRDCAQHGRKGVFLAGDGDFAEIAVLSSFDTPARAVAVIDQTSDRSACGGVPVVASLEAVLARQERIDAILVTSLYKTRATYESIRAQMIQANLPADTIHVPRILNFRPEP
jgi:DNA-binding Lrp family transcriptional regulator